MRYFLERGNFRGGIFHGENFPWRELFPKMNFQWGNFQRGNLPEFLYEIIFVCLLFSLSTHMFKCGDLPWKLSWGNCQRG